MSSDNNNNDHLSDPTSIFGLSLSVVLGVGAGAAFVLVLVLISLYFAATKRSKNKSLHPSTPADVITKEIHEIRIDHVHVSNNAANPNPALPSPRIENKTLTAAEEDRSYQKVHVDIGKDNRITYPCAKSSSSSNSNSHGGGSGEVGNNNAVVGPEVSHLGWGHWYTLRELEMATNGFVDENVIGEGGYGIVYHGVLEDKSHVAVKNLLNNKGQAEKEFKVEVEVIGRVRHKNLVRLLGFCAEGAHRMLVYEYVNNGNLEQWIHGDVGPVSPLTWEIRMNIILKTAKGLSYLHEGLEPKVIHRDIKSSNILLDKQWNAKVSDFGLAKLIGSERSYITTRVMGTFGYVAPEYASTGMLNERSDVYSFGILIMEIISGRNPVDYSQPPGEVNLVEWLKKMVANREPEKVLDPKIPEKPRSRALKRALLVALKCVDPNALKRPRMGHVVHMLEAEEEQFKDDGRSIRTLGGSDDNVRNGLKEKQVTGTGDGHGSENGMRSDKIRQRQEEEKK